MTRADRRARGGSWFAQAPVGPTEAPTCGAACAWSVFAAAGVPRPWPSQRALRAAVRRLEPSARERRAWIAPPEGLRRVLDARLARGAYALATSPVPTPARTPTGRLTRATHAAARAFTARAHAAVAATGRPALVAVRRGRHWVALVGGAADLRSVRLLDPAAPSGPTVVRRAAWRRNLLTPVTPRPGRPTRFAGAWVALLPVAPRRARGDA